MKASVKQLYPIIEVMLYIVEFSVFMYSTTVYYTLFDGFTMYQFRSSQAEAEIIVAFDQIRDGLFLQFFSRFRFNTCLNFSS